MRYVLTAAAVLLAVGSAEALGRRGGRSCGGRGGHGCSVQSYCQPTGAFHSVPVTYCGCQGGGAQPIIIIQQAAPAVLPPPAPAPKDKGKHKHDETDALGEVNAARAKAGLPPFLFDKALTVAARNAATYRAEHLIEGHTANDFAYLPSGSTAAAAGCAAWQPSQGWGSCCTYDSYSRAGAAISYGRDGRRFMHIYVR